jgi:hypothetical protein
MSKMKDLMNNIESLYVNEYPAWQISMELNIPIDVVDEAIEKLNEKYDEPWRQ